MICFDTNILVYATASVPDAKARRALALKSELEEPNDEAFAVVLDLGLGQ